MNSHPAQPISHLKVISLIISNPSLRYGLDRLLREAFTLIVFAKDPKCKALTGAGVIA